MPLLTPKNIISLIQEYLRLALRLQNIEYITYIYRLVQLFYFPANDDIGLLLGQKGKL